jgi:hypothetical protein
MARRVVYYFSHVFDIGGVHNSNNSNNPQGLLTVALSGSVSHQVNKSMFNFFPSTGASTFGYHLDLVQDFAFPGVSFRVQLSPVGQQSDCNRVGSDATPIHQQLYEIQIF